MIQRFRTPIKLQWRRITFICGISIGLLLWSSCGNIDSNVKQSTLQISNDKSSTTNLQDSFSNKAKLIHVFVALCDNEHQGIIPVPKAIGNGKDPDNNLYWGCDYGLRAFFKNKTQWKLIKTIKNAETHVLERCVFKHKQFNNYLVADAYDGEFIKDCTIHFLKASSGNEKKKMIIEKDTLGIGGNAQLLAYIGHDGLMDFRLNEQFLPANNLNRSTIILACKSKQFFAPIIKQTKAKPLLWTTQLMCPEAYTLDAALNSWLKNEGDIQVHQKASEAYSKYQHCSVKAAKGLLATGY